MPCPDYGDTTFLSDKQDQTAAYIHYVSPTKESNFFDLQLQSKDKYMRGVCFGPGKRGLFQSLGG